MSIYEFHTLQMYRPLREQGPSLILSSNFGKFVSHCSYSNLLKKTRICSHHVRPDRLSFPFFLSEVVDLRRGGKGYRVKVFSSLELTACWERVGWKIDVLEQGLRVMILILLGNSWFEFLSTSIFPPFLTNPWREKNLFRGKQ